MALSNLPKERVLNVKDLISSYITLYKKDMVLVNLVGKNFNVTILHYNNAMCV